MDQTFEQLWKRILLYAPGLPLPLAQEFINTAYSRALEAGGWYGLRAEAEFIIPDAFTTGTITLTQSSASATGSGTGWTSALDGRQLIIGGKSPFYTVTITSPTTLTLDRPWADEDQAAVTYSIEQIYVTAPSDFIGFRRAVSPVDEWRLHTNITQEQVDLIDPTRNWNGTPRALLPAPPTSAGLRRFEVWPRSTAARFIHYLYTRRPSLLSAASDRPIFPIRGDLIRHGALVELCSFPGTKQLPNVWFDLNAAGFWQDRFEKGIAQAQREDQGIAQTDVTYQEESWPWAPLDPRFLQTHPDFLIGY